MFYWWIFSTITFIILTKFYEDAVANQFSEKISFYQINGKRFRHVVSDKFLSFTMDPEVLIYMSDCKLDNTSITLIRSLLPAYMRIAGPSTDKLSFVIDPTSNKKTNLFVTKTTFVKLNEFISKTGLNLIIGLNSNAFYGNTNLNLNDVFDFITFSNNNNFSLDWQLGFEVQQSAKDDGKKTAEKVVLLRRILNNFPVYQNSLIIGPDMTNFENESDISFIKNYLDEVQNASNVFTLHPFSSNKSKSVDLYDHLSEILSKMDNYLWSKESTLKPFSKGVVPKKPIWAGEWEFKETICQLSDCILMIERIGVAAKLGISVYFRQPHLLSFYEPTPEYWVLLLYKKLVGRSVLDMKLIYSNASKMQIFSHCTQIQQNPQGTIINSDVIYEPGSVTVYGANAASESSRISFQIDLKIEETVHIYILTEEMKNDSVKTLLNKEQLRISRNNELPTISPEIFKSAKYVIVPARSIFFIVFPNIVCRACVLQNIDEQNMTKAFATNKERTTIEINSYSNVPEIGRNNFYDNIVYVNHSKRNQYQNITLFEIPTINDEKEINGGIYEKLSVADENNDDKSYLHPEEKFVTVADETWLSSFPENLKKFFDETQEKAKMESNLMQQYRLMARAIFGKRNHTNINLHRDLDQFKKQFRFQRYTQSSPYYPNMLIDNEKLNLFVDQNYNQMNDEPYAKIDTPKLKVESDEVTYDDINLNSNEENIFEENVENRTYRKKRDTDILSTIYNQEQTVTDTTEIGIEQNKHSNESKLIRSTYDENINSSIIKPLKLDLMNEQEIRALISETEDKISNTVRANRQVNDEKKDTNEYYINNASFDLLERQQPLSKYGPVSPFPRKSKSIKNNLKTVKPTDNSGIVSSIQINGSSKLSTSPTINDAISSNQSSVNLPTYDKNVLSSKKFIFTGEEDVSETKIEYGNERKEIKIPSSLSFAPTHFSYAIKIKNNANTKNANERANFTENITSVSTSTTARNIHGRSLENFSKNIETKDDIEQDLFSKIVSPIKHVEHNTKVAGTDRAYFNSDIRKTSFTRNPVTPISLDMKSSKINLAQLFDHQNEKIKTLLDQYKTKIEELKKKIHKNAEKLDTERDSYLRNKREAANESTDDSIITSVLKNDDHSENSSYDVVALPPRKVSRIPFHVTTPKSIRFTTTDFVISSTKRSFPRKVTKSSSRRTTPRNLWNHKKSTTSADHTSKKNKDTISNMSETLVHNRIERDIMDDIFTEIKTVYEGVSGEIKNKINPASKWIEKNVSDIKSQDKGIIGEMEKTLNPIQKWIGESIESVKSEFESRSKRDTHEKKKGIQQIKDEILGKLNKYEIRNRDVSARIQKLNENEKNIHFPLNSKNTILLPHIHAHTDRKKNFHTSEINSKHKRAINSNDVTNQIYSDIEARSLLINDLFTDENEAMNSKVKGDNYIDCYEKHFNSNEKHSHKTVSNKNINSNSVSNEEDYEQYLAEGENYSSTPSITIVRDECENNNFLYYVLCKLQTYFKMFINI